MDRRRARRLRAWIPSVVLGLLIVGVVVGATVASSSWWAEDEPVAAGDQLADDGSSLFTGAGIDYMNGTRAAIVKVRDNPPAATELGLPAEGTTEVEFLTPVQVRVLGAESPLVLPLSPGLTVHTAGDRITRLEVQHLTTTYASAIASIRENADRIGWSAAVADTLADDLAAAADASDDPGTYSAITEVGTAIGADVTARLDVAGGVALRYIVEPTG